MDDNHAALTRLLDEAGIQRAIAWFADAATLADYDAFRRVWADDGEWTIGDPPRVSASGVEDIVATLRRLRMDKDFFVQFALPGVIAIAGHTSTARGFGHEAARGPGETYYRNHYMVLDSLRRGVGGEWVFASRAFKYIWLDTAPFSGDGFSIGGGGTST